MIGYVTLGTNDLAKAADFYDELLKEIGAIRAFDSANFVAWSIGENEPMLSVITPYDGNPATIGNGTMVGLKAENTEVVDQLHAKAIALGGANEGDPGMREGGFYCAYFRDLDGNKLNFFCIG